MNSTTLSRAAFLFVSSFFPVFANAQAYSGPSCLGPFCVDRKLSQDDVFEQLGAPGSTPWDYRSQDKSQLLRVIESTNFNVGGLILSDPSYFHRSGEQYITATKVKFGDWKTTEGIGLGSSEMEVRKAYGKPSGETTVLSQGRDAPIETKRLFYKGRLNNVVEAAAFDIRNGKVSSIELETDAYPGPNCLGLFCAYHGLSLHSFLAHLGPPVKISSRPGDYCYQSLGSGAFLLAESDHVSPSELDAVLLSDFPSCRHSATQTTENDLRAWKTPEGIGLGSTEADVWRAYGKPDQEGKVDANNCCDSMLKGFRTGGKLPDVGNKSLRYAGQELERAEFGIRNGKVSYIVLSYSE
ncbi:MAG: hypothetical protein ACHQT6_12185 [Candidatus Acidiferrales bacterium]